MRKKICFRLTIRNVNTKKVTLYSVATESFRLTIRNVNLINIYFLGELKCVLD